MNETTPRLHRKFKIAACLLGLGLLAEAATLHWSHPTSFLFFIGVGGFLVIVGMALYLLAIVSE